MAKRIFLTDTEVAAVLEVSPKTLYRMLTRAPLRRKHEIGRRLDIGAARPVVVNGMRRWRLVSVASVLGVAPDEIEARLS